MHTGKMSFVRMMRIFSLLLIPIVIVDVMAVILSVYHNRQAYLTDVRTKLELETGEKDTMLLSVNRYMNGLLNSNENLARLIMADNKIDQIYYANCLLNDITLSTVFLPSDYHFCIEVPEQQMFLATEAVEVDYVLKEQLNAHIRSEYHQEGYVNRPQWKLIYIDNVPFLCQTYRLGHGFITCWTKAARFFSYINNSFVNGTGSYLLSGNSKMDRMDPWSGTLQQTLVMDNCDLAVTYQFTYSSSSISTMILLLTLVLIVLFVIAYGICSARFYLHNLLQPLQHFATELPDDAELQHIETTARFTEIAQVAEAIQRLYGQVRRLKIEYYEETIARQRIELEYLQLQLRPHFFINCLTVIFNFAQQGEYRKIQCFCVKLSSYIRYLFSSGIKTIPLSEELKHISEYLYIQNIRFHTTTNFVNLSQGAADEQVPSLMFLSLVENAVKHNRTLGHELTIDLEMRRSGEWVIYTVRDNGLGFGQGKRRDEDDTHEIKASSGIGLKNIRRQLELLYGERFEFSYCNAEGGGATIRIVLPADAGIDSISAPKKTERYN